MDQRYKGYNDPALQHRPYSPLFPGGPTWEEIMGESNQEPDHLVW